MSAMSRRDVPMKPRIALIPVLLMAFVLVLAVVPVAAAPENSAHQSILQLTKRSIVTPPQGTGDPVAINKGEVQLPEFPPTEGDGGAGSNAPSSIQHFTRAYNR